ncbi:MAG: BolA/IbaG family iron-sulfur metabolism protein [Bdellovibrionales bacterium]
MTPEQMKDRLQKTYANAQITVNDLTGTHDHYEVVIESSAFEGLSRMQQHRAVMDVFDPELKTGEVHALTIRTLIPKK